jgi:Domain of unknown function (DUF4166)
MIAAATREHAKQSTATDLRDRIHADVARLHFGDESLSAKGIFNMRRGQGIAVRLGAGILRLPPPARGVPLALRIERYGRREVWHRSFGGRRLDASFEHMSDQLTEGFGPLRLRYRMSARSGALVLDLVSANIQIGPVSVRLPGWSAPKVRARAWVRDGDGLLQACIIVLAPWGDLLLAYRGHLAEVTLWTA